MTSRASLPKTRTKEAEYVASLNHHKKRFDPNQKCFRRSTFNYMLNYLSPKNKYRQFYLNISFLFKRLKFVDFYLIGEEHNFVKLSGGEIDSRNEPYDYGSIMHYGKNTFAKAVSLETIIAKKRPLLNMRPQIGQREKLSRGDIKQTKKMYNCPGKLIKTKQNKMTIRTRSKKKLGENQGRKEMRAKW